MPFSIISTNWHLTPRSLQKRSRLNSAHTTVPSVNKATHALSTEGIFCIYNQNTLFQNFYLLEI